MTEHFQFAQPEWLYALPFILCLIILRRRRGAEGSITYPTVRFIASLARTPQSLAGKIGALCFVLAAAAIAIALARPQHVEDKTFRTVNGIDIMIAFDLSYSMETPDMVLNRMPINRLVAAKHVITQFVDSRPDDRIGIVGFAGKTKSFCPLTLDHALVNSIIRDFHPRMIQADGTAIGSAIAAAATRLDDRKETKSKIIILVTDGASNSGQISPLVAAENAAKLGIKIYTIAVGTEEGTLANGMVVQSEFDEPTLRKIAQLTGGEHFRATNMASFNKAFTSIGKLEKSEAKVQTVRHIEEYFMYFLVTGAALALLGLSLQVLKPARPVIPIFTRHDFPLSKRSVRAHSPGPARGGGLVAVAPPFQKMGSTRFAGIPAGTGSRSGHLAPGAPRHLCRAGVHLRHPLHCAPGGRLHGGKGNPQIAQHPHCY